MALPPPTLPRRAVAVLGRPGALRLAVQASFALTCIWIGIQFHRFVAWASAGGVGPAVERPPGVEAFLPISGLMSLRHLALTGQIHPVHPAALVLLGLALVSAVLLRKAFCGWVCPIGALVERLGWAGRRLGITVRPWRFLDLPLRGLKVLLLAFFVHAIWTLSPADLLAFLESPYNRVADVKMYQFFADLSQTTAVVVGLLALASFVVQGAWCRYLCPYGALLGIAGLLGPLRVERRAATCTGCRRCTRACPAGIQVHDARRVWSDECMACARCVEACPEPRTLALRLPFGGPAVPVGVLAALVVGLFVAGVGLARGLGAWESSVTGAEYAVRLPRLEDPMYGHPGR